MTRTQAKKLLAELVSKFESNLAFYKSDRFNEANTRQQFLNPFWRAFGWNLDDFNEVELEYDVPIGNREHLKYADYVFKINGRPVFIVEAKKPATDLKNVDVVFQVKRYGYNLQTVNFAVLTDFEEFRLFDCGIEPIYKNPQRGLLTQLDLLFLQYLENFDLLYDTFSREAVASGSLDKLLPKARQKAKQRIPVDKAFLKDLCEWRAQLAKDVAKKNPFDDYELNEAVQLLIDRIIFMRVVEDRQIEPTELVLDALNRWQREKEKPFYQYLADKFHWMAPQYNGLLFKASPYDNMLVDDRILQKFVESLYYPNSPYQFNIIGVELLGNIYEQFLGSTITVKETPKRRTAQVEPKPEVRKAGGVYYTPKYIVDYIVDQTVGKVIAGKTPKEIEKIRILDPACGSGSFLIGAFEKLIKYHEDYYAKHDKQNKLTRKEAMQDYDRKTGELRLYRKIRILKNNIFGVDIDHQAVEVTILSLYLKLLEGDQSLFLIKQSILPDMSDNIRCGNSLIGPDFYEGQQLTLDKAEERRINVFDWYSKSTGFGQIMEEGGFDCVIGNPPYLNLTKGSYNNLALDYFAKHYTTFNTAQSKNLFTIFIEKALKLLKKPSRFSFIVPEALAHTLSNKETRLLLSNQGDVDTVLLFDKFVFRDAMIGNIVFCLSKPQRQRPISVLKYCMDKGLKIFKYLSKDEILQSRNLIWDLYSEPRIKKIMLKLGKGSFQLGSKYTFYKGMVVKDRKSHLRSQPKANDLPFLLGNCMHRYMIFKEFYTDYDELTIVGGTKSLQKHLVHPRLLIRRTGNILCATFSNRQELIESTLYIMPGSSREELLFILGLINSKALTFYVQQNSLTNIQAYPQIIMSDLEQLPIHTINFDNPVEKAQHDRLVTLVDTMLDLHKKLQTASTETDKRRIQTRIEHTDRQIDQLVYELYALTEKEIKIVEGEK